MWNHTYAPNMHKMEFIRHNLLDSIYLNKCVIRNILWIKWQFMGWMFTECRFCPFPPSLSLSYALPLPLLFRHVEIDLHLSVLSGCEVNHLPYANIPNIYYHNMYAIMFAFDVGHKCLWMNLLCWKCITCVWKTLELATFFVSPIKLLRCYSFITLAPKWRLPQQQQQQQQPENRFTTNFKVLPISIKTFNFVPKWENVIGWKDIVWSRWRWTLTWAYIHVYIAHFPCIVHIEDEHHCQSAPRVIVNCVSSSPVQSASFSHHSETPLFSTQAFIFCEYSFSLI